MLLAIDIGNTQTSFGLFKDRSLTHHWKQDTRACTTADACAAFLQPLLQYNGLRFGDIRSGVLCSVVPPANRIFHEFFAAYLGGCLVQEIGLGSRLAFRLNVETPAEVGADRLANAQFACHLGKLPTIVIDFGTATTFDLILPGTPPTYEGGVIVPGVRIGLDALSGRTSKLFSVDLNFPPNVVGKNTTTCIQSGLLYGYVDLVDGLLVRFEREVGERCHTVITGGLGVLFAGRLQRATEYLPNLTLDGILLIAGQ